ncbi:MAG: histidine kinase, partial [Mariniphaga sp.]|nr:histidine kinase [Mariniphaga sp.]
MALRSYYTNIIVRVCLLVLWSLIIGWLLFNQQTYVGCFFIGIILFIQVLELIYYLNRTNRKIAFFFDAIRNEDSTLFFAEKTGNKSLNELNFSLNKVNDLIKEIKFELQEQEQYFKTILEHVSIGILTFNEKGVIFLSNTATKNLLNYEHLTHIKQLSRIDKKLYLTLKELKPGDMKLASFNNGQEIVQLSLKSTLFKTSQENLQLVTIQDIKNELEAKELESWIKLIRVLTHEIMNTIAPITSLSQTILGYYKNLDGKTPDEKIIDNTIKGMEVINERGIGLIGFVDSYRKLTRLPQPDKKTIDLGELFDRIITLINIESIDTGIKINWEVNPRDLEVLADRKQISQVLINLIKNSSDALKNISKGEIILEGKINDRGRPQISVSDNGPGIPDELMDK